jgi:hypothetical protein
VGVFNRRNAAVGWVTWSVGKRVLKRKAKDAVSEAKAPRKKKKLAALALGAAGAATFWKKRSGGDKPSD